MQGISFLRNALRYGLAAIAAGAVLCSGTDWGSPPEHAIVHFSQAGARDRDGKDDDRKGGDRGGDDDRGERDGAQRSGNDREDDGHRSAGDDGRDSQRGGDRERKGGDDNRARHGSPDSDEDSSEKLSYDASKNLLKLHLKLGAGSRHKGHELEAPHRFSEGRKAGLNLLTRGTHGEKDNSRQLGSIPLRSLKADDWHREKSLAALDKVLRPIESRYHRSIMTAKPKAMTFFTKTKLGIGGLSFVPNEVLAVNPGPGAVARAEALGFRAEHGSQGTHGKSRVVRFSAPPGLDAIRAEELLTKELPGQQFGLNRVYRLYRAAMRNEAPQPKPSWSVETAPSPCAGDHCFPRKIIQWQDQFGSCARGLRVGIIDTAIDIGHPAFKGRHIHRDSFAPDNRPAAPDWHGTGVLALLAGDPVSGTPGLIPDAEFFEAGVFFSEENGGMATDTSSLLKALDWMQANKVKLINMSFSGPRDELVQDAIGRMTSEGVVFVAAAGNEGPTADPSYPAAYPQVVAVTAITQGMHNYRYANRGDHIDVAAPGVDIWTAVPGGREGYHSGTSFAAPYVTAILAVLPRDKVANSKAPLLDGLSAIDLGPAGRDPIYGRGLLLAPSSCAPPSEMVASVSR